MTKSKRWPNHVEDLRLDAVAVQLEIMSLAKVAQQANMDGDAVEVQKLLKMIYEQARRGQLLLNEARKRQDDDRN